VIPHNKEPQSTKRVAIIGAGISGLAAAFCLTHRKNPPAVTVFEATHRVGGVLATEHCDGFLLERSADSFLVNAQMPWAERLAVESGFEDLVKPLPGNRRALIVKHGATLPVPEGFYLASASRMSEVMRSPILSWSAKLRLAAERFVRTKPTCSDESLEQFAVRRVGREVFEWLVQPLVSGIYTADPAKLSVRAALPQLIEMEEAFGSLTAGLKQRDSLAQRSAGARYGMFRAPKRGMQSFVEHVANQLPEGSLRLRSRVLKADRIATGRWLVSIENEREEKETFDSVIVALPSPQASSLLRSASPALSGELASIELAGVAIVCLGYDRGQIGHPLDAFGLVVPNVEQRDIVAISIASNKFPDRAPKGSVLLRVFLGGACRPDLLELDDATLKQRAIHETSRLLQIQGLPQLSKLNRWKQDTPQYHVGHVRRLDRIDRLVKQTPGLALAGNAYDGIGIPQCIRSGYLAAEMAAEG